MNVSRKAPKPLYQQVKDHIMGYIVSGEWPPDTRIPSELELANSLRVSRMTVNRALRELTSNGQLIRLQGVGTYVAQPRPMKALFEINSIDEEVMKQGGIYSCEVILLAEEKAFDELASAMEIAIDAPVFHSVTVHKKNDQPVLLADRYVNPVSAPDYLKQDFTQITPSRYLLKTVPLSDVEHILEAVRPDKTTRRLLDIPPDEPCLVLHRQTWDTKRVATHSRLTYPGSRYRIGGRFQPLKPWYEDEFHSD